MNTYYGVDATKIIQITTYLIQTSFIINNLNEYDYHFILLN